MAYVVKQKVNGSDYYYLVHNSRVENGWKKKKKYIGKELPADAELERLKKEWLSGELKQEEVFKLEFLHEEQKKSLEPFKIDRVKFKATNEIVSNDNEINFLINFTFNSNAIEGSSLNPEEVKMVFNDELPYGKKLREVLEAKNTEQCYNYIKTYEKDMTRNFILEVHRRLMYYILDNAGEVRKYPVEIPGSNFQPPAPENLEHEMDRFVAFYNFIKKKYHPLEVASLVHIKFAELHPFSDGNGRVSRLLMNFVLMKNGVPPVIIENSDKYTYYDMLEKTHVDKDYKSFINYMYGLMMSKYKV